jgi:hypothetical protein
MMSKLLVNVCVCVVSRKILPRLQDSRGRMQQVRRALIIRGAVLGWD